MKILFRFLFALLFLGVLIRVASMPNGPFNAAADKEGSMSTTTHARDYVPPPAVYALNQGFRVGYWSYRVTAVTNTPWLPDFGDRLKACDSGNCVIVGLNIRNEDRTSSHRPTILLIDSAGREFDESVTLSRSELSGLQTLNPGVGKSGFVAFDAPRGQYQLKVSGGIESGVWAMVNLQ